MSDGRRGGGGGHRGDRGGGGSRGDRGGGGGFRGDRGGGGGFRGDRGGGGGGFRGDRGGGGFRGDRGGGGGGFRGDRGGGGGGFRGDRGGGGGGFRGDRGGGDRGGGGGFRGDRGGGGRGGRGRLPFVTWSTEKLPHERPVSAAENTRMVAKGWVTKFPDNKDDIVLPIRNDTKPAKEFESKVILKVNHFLANIKLPKTFYHYQVEMSRLKGPTASTSSAPPQGQGRKKIKSPDPGRGSTSAQGAAAAPEIKRFPRDLRLRILRVLVPQLQTEYTKATRDRVGIITDYSDALYSTKRLETCISMTSNVSEDLVEPEEARGGTFQITLRPTDEEIDTSGLAASINARRGLEITQDLLNIDRIYNTMLKNLENHKFTPVGRSSLILFDGESSNLGGGVVNFSGYNAILGITNGWKPYLNVDIANSATIMNKNVLEVLANLWSCSKNELGNVSQWNPSDFDAATSLLKACKVQYKPAPGKTFGGTVVSFSRKSVSEITFELKQPGDPGPGRKTTVFDYFRQMYKTKLEFPQGACLVLNGQKQIPAEICVVKKGQSYNRKLDGDQTTKMLECGRKAPGELQEAIHKVVNDLRLKNNEVLKDFGVTFEGNVNMLELKDTRVLAPPILCYGKNSGPGSNPANASRARFSPIDGQWDIYRMNFEFLEPKSIKSWGLLLLARCYDDQIDHFLGKFLEKAKLCGVTFNAKPHKIQETNLPDRKDAVHDNVKILSKTFNDFKIKECSFVLVVIPKKGCELYNHVKQAAELKVGILTQCVVMQNFAPKQEHRTDSIVGNIMLKLNSKLGGINHVVLPAERFASCFKIFTDPVMILGADVTHPPLNFAKTEVVQASFAAVTGSINRTGMPYMMHVQAQEKAGKGAAEVIVGFKDIIVKFLKQFWKQTKGLKPVKIIYFRDGVGEGQFPEVLHIEMRAIREACMSLAKGGDAYEPKITFITVQKRHKTRFFLQDGRGVENAPPGTVVDVEIVHPTETDFFLLSHRGLLGTSRPTRYHLLWDDSDFSADEIQTLSYYLCYMYVRCNRSVRIPAPTYYSHWAAARAKALTEGISGSVHELNDYLRREQQFENNYPMHFVYRVIYYSFGEFLNQTEDIHLQQLL